MRAERITQRIRKQFFCVTDECNRKVSSQTIDLCNLHLRRKYLMETHELHKRIPASKPCVTDVLCSQEIPKNRNVCSHFGPPIAHGKIEIAKTLAQGKSPWVDSACADCPASMVPVLLVPRLPTSSTSLICFMASWTFAWICCPQLPYHLCKKEMSQQELCNIREHTTIYPQQNRQI